MGSKLIRVKTHFCTFSSCIFIVIGTKNNPDEQMIRSPEGRSLHRFHQAHAVRAYVACS